MALCLADHLTLSLLDQVVQAFYTGGGDQVS